MKLFVALLVAYLFAVSNCDTDADCTGVSDPNLENCAAITLDTGKYCSYTELYNEGVTPSTLVESNCFVLNYEALNSEETGEEYARSLYKNTWPLKFSYQINFKGPSFENPEEIVPKIMEMHDYSSCGYYWDSSIYNGDVCLAMTSRLLEDEFASENYKCCTFDIQGAKNGNQTINESFCNQAEIEDLGDLEALVSGIKEEKADKYETAEFLVNCGGNLKYKTDGYEGQTTPEPSSEPSTEPSAEPSSDSSSDVDDESDSSGSSLIYISYITLIILFLF